MGPNYSPSRSSLSASPFVSFFRAIFTIPLASSKRLSRGRLTSRAVGFAHFKATSRPGQWDIWKDALGLWEPMGIACVADQNILPNIWNHLSWNLHQANGMVFYDTLTVKGVATRVNLSYYFLYESVGLDPTT